MEGITLVDEGARIYITGNTFPIKEQIKETGGHYDRESGRWWIGKAKRAAIQALIAGPAAASPTERREPAGADTMVAGRVTYKGSPAYIKGYVAERGRTRWDADRVAPVQSRDGQKILLVARDGSREWWALRAEVTVEKNYDRPQTIGGIARYAVERKAEAKGEKECPVCARHCTCGTSQFCVHHHDGCDRCGAEG